MRGSFFSTAFQHDTMWEHIWTWFWGCISEKVLGFPFHNDGLIHLNQLHSASTPIWTVFTGSQDVRCCVQLFKCCSLSLQMNPLCLITGSFQLTRSSLLPDFSHRFGYTFFPPFYNPYLDFLCQERANTKQIKYIPSEPSSSLKSVIIPIFSKLCSFPSCKQ